MSDLKHEELTSQIIKSYYRVYNTLGPGFLESVYQNSLVYALREESMEIQSQFPIKVHFDKIIVGKFIADVVVNDLVIIEIKAVNQLMPQHEAQLFNYLKATSMEIGLLFNFGNSEPEFHRKIVTNNHKPHLKNPF